MSTTLQNAIDFFERFGFFSVIVPFLLVFTIVFAILEKTRVLGEEDGEPRKNLNSMVAFAVALLVVATVRVVEAINKSLPAIAFLLIASVSFLMLVGLFYGTGEIKFEKGWQRTFIFVVMFIAIIAVFLYSLGWLDVILSYVGSNWDRTVVPSVIFFIIILVVMWYVIAGGEGKKKKEG